ncbi:MAG: pyridoxamine 5'-phosphate oxidase family protein [Nocardioides sp.]
MAWSDVSTLEQLVEIVGEPSQLVIDKVRDHLAEVDRVWLAASPFCMLATADALGNVDNSPKGDPAGSLVHIIDERTIAIAERPGNRRVDGYRNVLQNPHIGLTFLIPGRGDTLRINGRARLVGEADFFDQMIVKGHRPILAVIVEIEEVFFHCAKAFLRSNLWEPQTWQYGAGVPPRAEIAAQVEAGGRTREQLQEHYLPENYEKGLYGAANG